ncbi:MAG TPA: NAD(P)H-hydrate epimerase [Tepidisphaeraceae bacterium]|jgi:NAD(P)H-hydrate epimerase
MKDEKNPNAIRLNREQARAVDKIATDKYRMPSIILMENAARQAADFAEKIVAKNTARFQILCGPGNNGGDGLAMARHLHRRGHRVEILLLADPAKYKGDALINWNIVQAMQIPQAPLTSKSRFAADLLIDALFGTGLTEAPRDPFARIASSVNDSSIPILSIDIPSGLDCNTGTSLGPVAIRAAHAITFVAEKIGFANPAAAQYLGQVSVADIGCPKECINEALSMQ